MKLAFLTGQQVQFSDQLLWVLGSVALIGIGMLQAGPTAEWEASTVRTGPLSTSRLLDRTPLAWLTAPMGVLKTHFLNHRQFIYAANINASICWGQWIHSQRNSSGKMSRTCSNEENVTFQWLSCHFFFCFVVVSLLDKASHLFQSYSNFHLYWNNFDCQIQHLFSKINFSGCDMSWYLHIY